MTFDHRSDVTPTLNLASRNKPSLHEVKKIITFLPHLSSMKLYLFLDRQWVKKYEKEDEEAIKDQSGCSGG